MYGLVERKIRVQGSQNSRTRFPNENFVISDANNLEYLALGSKLSIPDLEVGDLVEFVPSKILLGRKLAFMADFVKKRSSIISLKLNKELEKRAE